MYLKRCFGLVVVAAFLFTLPAFAELPQISGGINYLTSSQSASGNWDAGGSAVETTAATASALESLKLLNQSASTTYSAGASWLQAQSPQSVGLIAERIVALGLTDGSANGLLPALDTLKGAWGGYDGYETDVLDTALALQALKTANYSDPATINTALAFLASSQNPDGGWGFCAGDGSNVYMTAIVSATLQQFPQMTAVASAVGNATNYLLSSQNADGGFGGSGSSVYETALAFIALAGNGQTQGPALQNAAGFLTSTQSADGSWNEDPYSTALALRALAGVKSDLSISAGEVAVSPSQPTAGDALTVTATVHNIGLDAAANITVRLSDNGTTASDKIVAAINPGGTGIATFTIPNIAPYGDHNLGITIDPANAVDEMNKANNTASTRIWVKVPADLAVSPENLGITPAYPKPGDTVTLSAKIANMGETAAGTFSCDVYDGDPNGGGVKLGSFTIPGIASGEWGSGSVTFTLATAGIHTLYLIADPQHSITELSTGNNSAQKAVTVSATNGSGFIDLTIPMSGIQITPQRPKSGDTVNVTLLAGNLGTQTGTADLELFDGDPAAGGILLYKSALTFSAGESRTVSVPWQISAGIHTLRPYLDRANTVAERDKTNNSQTLGVMADMVDIEISTSDIVIAPEHPMDGDPAIVKLTVQNRGIAPTGPFNVNLYNGDPNNGGTLLQSFPIADLAGDATREVDYSFTAVRGTYRFYALCDPENRVTELYESNNLAIRTLLVKTSAEAKGPDLVPLELDLSGATTDPQSLHITGTAKVTFQNKGDDKVAVPFRITVFQDMDGDGIYTEGTDAALGSWDYSAPLSPSMVGTAAINLSGTLTFRDAPIYAMLDSAQAVFEQSKTNNTIRKGSACEARPVNPIQPVLKWQWRSGNTGAPYFAVSPPIVIGLTDDNGDGKIDEKDTPSVVFVTQGYQNGKIEVLNGITGKQRFTISDLAHQFNPGTIIAAGDINNDGKPEILIEGGFSGMLSYSNDGHLLWDNADTTNQWQLSHNKPVDFGWYRTPKIADIDGSGHPVIVSGATVVNPDGSIRSSSHVGYSGSGDGNQVGGASAVADLDMDGKQEIIAGNVAINSDGSIKWYNTAVPDGVSVIVNFGDDPYPEILTTTNSSGLYLLDHNGNIKWGPVYPSSWEGRSASNYGSVPTIADFDGDGQVEIGIKGYTHYFIIDSNGRLKRALPIPRVDPDNWYLGATVFDLNGDGRPEVIIYSDQYLRIFDGKTGTLLYEEQAGKATNTSWIRYGNRYMGVVVADVDGDGHAELVVTGENWDQGLNNAEQWVRVYSAKNNDWLGTRHIWNQGGYHVTNVNDDGSIPRYEAPSWLTNNSYHCNVPTSTGPDPYLAPDLSASFVRVDMANYPSSAAITARIGNGGALAADAGAKTNFYDGDPANGGTLIGSAVTTRILNPGDYEDVTLVWSTPTGGNHTIQVSADPDGTVPECDKTNNTVTAAVFATSGQPDLSVAPEDVVARPVIPEGSQTEISVTVRNSGTLSAANVPLSLYLGNPAAGGRLIGASSVASLAAGGSERVTFTWNTLGALGTNYLYAVADPAATISESNKGNNIAIREVAVTPADKPDLQIAAEDIAITPASAAEGDTLTITATAHNRGSQTGNIKVSLYDGNPTAGGVKRGETVLPQLVANGGSATTSFTLDTVGLAGSHAFYLLLDPDNAIAESDETNNQAVRTVTITPAGVIAAIVADKAGYSANEPVNATVTLAERSGVARSLAYDLQVLDQKGATAATVPETALTLAASAVQTFSIAWNTGTTYAGPYTLTVRVKENGRIVAKGSVPISINPVQTADLKVTLDKVSYGANEQVAVTATLTGNSPNYIYNDAIATTSILNGSGQTLYSSAKAIPSLANGQRIEIKNYWNTATLAPGSYPVTTEVRDAQGAVVASASQAVTITGPTPSSALSGLVAVDKQSVMVGETVTISGTLTNRGNADLSAVAVTVLTVHTANQNIYDTMSYQTALPMNGSYAFTGQIDTSGLSAKDYLVILRASIDGVEGTISGTYFRVEGAPSAPALAGPAEGSDVASFTPQLSVNNAADPNDDKLSYQFELYGDSGFTSLVDASGSTLEGSGITSWTTSASLTENQTYYWRARAYDGKLYGPWMAPATFRVNTVNDPPTAPTVATPADGTAVAVASPTLTVNNASDPDSTGLIYDFDLALDPGFTEMVTSTTGVASGTGTSSWTVPLALQENQWYYWRARADDWQISGPWSQPARFQVNTANDAPSIPVIVLPASGSTVAALSTDVSITNSTDPDSSTISYFFEADTVATFDSANVIRSSSVTQGNGSTTWNLNGLADNTRYYVRAKASDGAAESPWSDVVSFFANTVNDPPTTPIPANPSDGAGVNLFSPSLSVYNATDPDNDPVTYEFQVYADAALTTPVAQAAGLTETAIVTSWIVPVALTENQTYYWRARASDGALTSAWSRTQSFMVNTANDAPGAPTAISPTTGASVATLTPTLTIGNASDPDTDTLSYDFEVYSGATLVASKSGIAGDASGNTSWIPGQPLTDNTLYQWRARAYDGDRYGEWMPMATFTTHLPVTAITADIRFEPETLNQTSAGKWVTVEIELPRGYKSSDIDMSSIRLEGTVPAEPWPYQILKGQHGNDSLKVKFSRSAVIGVLPEGKQVPVQVTGRVGAVEFEGLDVIWVMK